MADRDDRWNENRGRSNHADRRPGGDRDFYGRDTRFEDDYGVGFGEEGVTNYRLRQPDRSNPGNQDRAGGGGGYSGSRDYGQNYAGTYGRNDARGTYAGGGNRNPQSGDFGRDFSSDQGFAQRREYSNPTGYSPDYNRDYQGRYNEGQRSGGHGDNRDDNRGFLARTGDEVASWFGDDDAERRRQEDARHGGRGPKGYRRSDERIREDVSDRLTDDPYIDASEIEVQVEGCEVTLTGSVASRNARRRAEDLAERISGVTHVQNNLRVTSGAESTREEREAAAKNPGLFSGSSKV